MLPGRGRACRGARRAVHRWGQTVQRPSMFILIHESSSRLRRFQALSNPALALHPISRLGSRLVHDLFSKPTPQKPMDFDTFEIPTSTPARIFKGFTTQKCKIPRFYRGVHGFTTLAPQGGGGPFKVRGSRFRVQGSGFALPRHSPSSILHHRPFQPRCHGSRHGLSRLQPPKGGVPSPHVLVVVLVLVIDPTPTLDFGLRTSPARLVKPGQGM